MKSDGTTGREGTPGGGRRRDRGAEGLGWDGTIAHEARSERQQVRLQIPFYAEIGDGRYRGYDVSINGFSVVGRPAGPSTERIPVDLVFLFRSFRLQLPLTARMRHTIGEGDQARTGFDIMEIDDEERRLLRKLISSHLSGTLVSLEGIIAPADGQVPRKTKARVDEAPDASARASLRKLARIAVTCVSMVAVVVFAILAVYENLFVIDAPFAAVTAPRIDIQAPGQGRFVAAGLLPGDSVARDQAIGVIEDPQLASDLAIADATLDYQTQLIATLDEALASGDAAAQRSIGASLRASAPAADADTAAGPDVDLTKILSLERSLDQLRARNALLEAKRNALIARRNADRLYSPCACTVHWSLGSSGKTWVDVGEKIYSLVPAAPDELLIEAQVPMDAVPRLSRAQRATIRLPNSGRSVVGRIIDINVEGERRPRAGFPRWVREDLSKATVLIAPERPLAGAAVGMPVEVTFSDASFRIGDWSRSIAAALSAAWEGLAGGAPDNP